MDFLEIRKKAKERAAARAAAAGAPSVASPGAAPPPPDAGRGAADDALVALLQALPAANDGRFTTWRPGDGAPPVPLDPGALAAAPSPGVAPTPETLAPAARADAPDAQAEGDHRSRVTPRAASPLDDFFYRPDEEAPELPDLGGGGAPAPDDAPVALEEYLTFLLGDEEYAVAIGEVREVLRSPPITEVPRAPADILGVVTVRGEVIPVLDPRRRLRLPPVALAEGAGRIVLVDAGQGPCGLLVDRVASVVRLRPGSIEPCPQGIAGASSDCLAGIGRERDRLFTVLDLGALLRRAAAPARASLPGGP
ncbi:chemotaxis protein CheW [Anaeromyxobacter oryzae]|uniref:CheW-like domain-containing protein n=1 Tax=Anaeromyxobacter oryzae TaxID=2918170 RepID=A0ABN6N1K1_9BACT|nr:chemotaxis protein CheW [Anaeromyxobacter oryzae]BDG05887.1 hypothetical protein AMOR_48830 [Anaeromyxobacter oryzae]